MNILYLDRSDPYPYNGYCSYYCEHLEELKKKNNLKLITKPISHISKVIDKKYDIIIVGFTYCNYGDRMPIEIINDVDIPIIIILNKEYTGLNKKLQWIKKIQPKMVFTVHHDVQKYFDITNIPFYRTMWSCNTDIYKNYGEKYKYDLFFAGVIRNEQTDNMRRKIYNYFQNNKSYNVLIKARLEENNYDGEILKSVDYAKLLSSSKICITTTGPADLVGQRYFEIMACNRGIIICNRHNNDKIYDNMLIEDFNCIMFSTIEEFKEKIDYYLKNENERLKIVNNAFKYFQENLTIDKHVNKMIDIIKQNL